MGLAIIKKGFIMKVKVGKWYLTRDDRRVFIESKIGKVFVGKFEKDICYTYWREDGSYINEEMTNSYTDDINSPYDLIMQDFTTELESLKEEFENKCEEANKTFDNLFRQSVEKCQPVIKTVCPFCYEETEGYHTSIMAIKHKNTCPVKVGMQLIHIKQEDSNEA